MIVNLTVKTIALLRARGYLCETVERWKRFPDRKKQTCETCGNTPLIGVRNDLFGFADIIAVKPGSPFTFVQVTSLSNRAARRNKIIASNEALLALLSGGQILIQSWRKNEKTNRWEAFDEWITKDQFVFGLATTVEQFYEDERRRKRPDLPAGSTLPLGDPVVQEEPF